MKYTSRYAGPDLTPEERDVRAALARYSASGATEFDWTPTATLWQTYLDWHASNRWRIVDDTPARLTRRQFGRAVRRVFPIARRRRRSNGKQRWGYAHLLGPFSITTPPPRKRVKQIA